MKSSLKKQYDAIDHPDGSVTLEFRHSRLSVLNQAKYNFFYSFFYHTSHVYFCVFFIGVVDFNYFGAYFGASSMLSLLSDHVSNQRSHCFDAGGHEIFE